MTQLRFGNLEDIYDVAHTHEEYLREQITLVRLEMHEFPLLRQRIKLSKELEILTQELESAEIKKMNLLCEIEYANSEREGIKEYGSLMNSLLEARNNKAFTA